MLFGPLLIAASLLYHTVQIWTWQHFPEAGFKVLAPVELQYISRVVPTEAAEINYHQYHGGSIADTSLAMVFVIDHYQIPLVPGVDSLYFRDLFETAIDQILTSIGGSLIYKDDLSNSERESCTWKASFMDGQGVIRGEMIYTEQKYYGLQVFGLAARNPDEDMNKFLESFKLTEQP